VARTCRQLDAPSLEGWLGVNSPVPRTRRPPDSSCLPAAAYFQCVTSQLNHRPDRQRLNVILPFVSLELENVVAGHDDPHRRLLLEEHDIALLDRDDRLSPVLGLRAAFETPFRLRVEPRRSSVPSSGATRVSPLFAVPLTLGQKALAPYRQGSTAHLRSDFP